MKDFANPDAWEFHEHLANQYGNAVRIHGVLGERQLYLSDPKALHHIVVKEQDVYEETDQFLALNQAAFGGGLFTSIGDKHRKQRKLLNPVFNNVHMRQLIPIFQEVTHRLQNTLSTLVTKGQSEIDLLHWMTRTALELVGTSGLGVSFDQLSLEADPHPYSRSVKNFVPTLGRLFLSQCYLLPIASKIGPAWFRRRVVDALPWKNLSDMKDIINVMHSTSVDILADKRQAMEAGDEALAQKVGQGNDLLSVLMKANMEASEQDRLPEVELLGHMTSLTFAAMDTTSCAVSRIFHLLATHPDVQDQLRQEIVSAIGDGFDLSFDDLNALPYLDAVCRETLRLYPPVTFVQRTTRKDAVLPLLTPIQGLDGREMNTITIPKNTTVTVSILNSNRNPEIWGPDSREWKPERWLDSLPSELRDARVPGVYSHLMTFLGGGRACIGFKFSLLEMKVVLSTLIKTFEFSPSSVDRDIVWEMNLVSAPALKSDRRPQLPMKVNFVDTKSQ
ncbi:cytochrome P450 [Infundibulicybe gibba]|nr:cytochrome P450 [Infundibulicybe gibba]